MRFYSLAYSIYLSDFYSEDEAESIFGFCDERVFEAKNESIIDSNLQFTIVDASAYDLGNSELVVLDSTCI